jgi:hypothetical protein
MSTGCVTNTMRVLDQWESILCCRDNDWNSVGSVFVYMVPKYIRWRIVDKDKFEDNWLSDIL